MFLLVRGGDKPFRVALVLIDPCQPSLWIEIEGCSFGVVMPWCEAALAFYHDLEEAAKLVEAGDGIRIATRLLCVFGHKKVVHAIHFAPARLISD
jgi:hypothetical protein